MNRKKKLNPTEDIRCKEVSQNTAQRDRENATG
jgi:hypothetical protein